MITTAAWLWTTGLTISLCPSRVGTWKCRSTEVPRCWQYIQFDPLNLALPTRSHHKGSYYTKRMSMYSNRLQPALQNLLQHVVWFFHRTASCTTMHISADVQRITLNVSCMTISGGKTKQLDIFCHVTGFTSDFLSFMLWNLFGSFTEPFNCLSKTLRYSANCGA